jgi:hypothetical protein
MSATTSPPAVYGRFGLTLAFAELALTGMLHKHLAKRGTKPDTYYGLHLIGARGAELDRMGLIEDLDRSRNVQEPGDELIARLEADGLIRGDARVEFTEEGEAHYRELREYVIGPTVRLLSQFEIEDIETTVRTLQAITEHAAADT